MGEVVRVNLQDKTVLVTGGTKGIGKACVEAFTDLGAKVIVNYNKDEVAATQIKAEMKDKITLIKADVSDQSQVDAMFEHISSSYKTIDVLINNVGTLVDGDSPYNVDVLEQEFDINLFGQIRIINGVKELMPKGKIILISSIHGKLGNGRPSATGYSASKAALNSYMKNLAKDVAPNILVNAIAPGRTSTPMWGEMTEERKLDLASGQLIERWIKPEEIADGAVFLTKNDAICGEVLVIDGGMSLRTLG
jgi:3-oxoacyl-[acyl-carrier protein] reductase